MNSIILAYFNTFYILFALATLLYNLHYKERLFIRWMNKNDISRHTQMGYYYCPSHKIKVIICYDYDRGSTFIYVTNSSNQVKIFEDYKYAKGYIKGLMQDEQQ